MGVCVCVWVCVRSAHLPSDSIPHSQSAIVRPTDHSVARELETSHYVIIVALQSSTSGRGTDVHVSPVMCHSVFSQIHLQRQQEWRQRIASHFKPWFTI